MTAEELSDVLGICGCCGDDVLELLRDMLDALAVTDWARALALAPDARSYEVILLLLDNLGLVEHGTAIRCSWLTDQGRAVLAALHDAKHVLAWLDEHGGRKVNTRTGLFRGERKRGPDAH